MWKVSLFFSIMFFIGCKMKSITGTYTSNNAVIIEISEDSSFVYSIKNGLASGVSYGSWFLEDDSLILRSAEALKPGIIKVEENKNNFEKEKFFKVIDDAGKPLPCQLLLNNEKGFSFNLNDLGEASIEFNKELSTITLYYLGDVFEYDVKGHKMNNFLIKVRVSDNSNFFIEKEKFEIKSNKLIDENGFKFKKNKTPDGL